MDLNIYVLVGIGILLILLVIWFIQRNKSDRKKFERDAIDSETTVEKQHNGPTI